MRQFQKRITILLVLASVLAGGLIAGIAFATENNNELKVVVSIRPLHSIIANIMRGADTPALIIEHSQSPHHANLKPSQAKMIANAEIIFWIGPELETFLQNPINAMARLAQPYKLLNIKELQLSLLPNGAIDPHIWLSTINAVAIAKHAVDKLIEADPESAKTYRDNLVRFKLEMSELQIELEELLKPQKDKHFLIYHDALRYLEHEFQFRTHAINNGNEETTISARQIIEVGKLIRSKTFQCLLVEPNINAAAIITLANENKISVVELDPQGADLPVGPGLYAQMMRNLATAIKNCPR